MKFVSYHIDGVTSYGAWLEGGILSAGAFWPEGPGSFRDVLRRQGGLDEAVARVEDIATPERLLAPEAVQLAPPIWPAGKLIGLAVNYVAHHEEFDRGTALPDKPQITPRPFLMPPTALAGPGSTIPWPDWSEQIDYELELAVVIGQQAKAIPPGQAREVIAGYTIANDVSARSVTHAAGRKERPKDAFFDWLHGKWADGFLPLGPCFVTAEAIGDPQDLTLGTTVNDEVRQDSHTSRMIFDVFELVAFTSRLMTLEPGDVIATGTPSGVGKATGKLLEPGDRIRCSIEKIGTLENTMGPRPQRFYRPCRES